jgi:hypothetical protein
MVEHMGDDSPDPGWRRGDEAAWWDAAARRWRQGTLVARVTVPTFEYDVTTPEGSVVRVPERLLRSPLDPSVSITAASTVPAAPNRGSAPTPPFPGRPGATLQERSGRGG